MVPITPTSDLDGLTGRYGLALLDMAEGLTGGRPGAMAAWLHGWNVAVALIHAGPELLPVYAGIETWWRAVNRLAPAGPDLGQRLLAQLQQRVAAGAEQQAGEEQQEDGDAHGHLG